MSGRDSARSRLPYRLLARFAQRRMARSNAQQKAARAGFNAGTHPRKIRYAIFVHRLGLKQRGLACLMERVEILSDAAGELLPSRRCTGADVQAVPSACRDDRRILPRAGDVGSNARTASTRQDLHNFDLPDLVTMERLIA